MESFSLPATAASPLPKSSCLPTGSRRASRKAILRTLLRLPHFTSEWQMGPPDLILKMPRPYRMPASGTDVFRNFVVPTGLTATKYVRGLELHLSDPRVVHHANVVLDRTQSMRSREGVDGEPGFPGMDVITEAAPDNFDPDSHFLFWKPATVLRPEPKEMSWRLDPGTDLVLNLHLQPTGKPESVQVEIGLYFHAPAAFPLPDVASARTRRRAAHPAG